MAKKLCAPRAAHHDDALSGICPKGAPKSAHLHRPFDADYS